MPLIRPDLAAALYRLREVLAALALAGFGGWLIWLGGYLLVPLGGGVVLLAAGWGLMAVRRLRFATPGDAPGVVEVIEGQVSYFGPQVGGSVGLPDLAELRLITLRGRRLWRLKQGDGQTLLIPVEAAGADRLFDAFASLPGMDMAALVAALAPRPATGATALALAGETVVIWRRTGRGVVAG